MIRIFIETKMAKKMENSKNVAVLITCHNRRHKTLACLEALYNCKMPEGYAYDVFLVDDGSTDGTGEAVRTSYPKVNVIQGNGNLYWNRGMHLAWKTAAEKQHYDFYLWLNDDSYLYNNALQEIICCSEKMQHNALICGFLCSEKDSIKTTYGGSTLTKKLNPNGDLQNVSLINGNVVLIPVIIFNSVGLIDRIFPHAIGDYDYGQKVIKNRFEVKTTTAFVGTCEKNEKLPLWCYRSTPLLKRIKYLYSPLGSAHPYYFFIYEKRHFGLLVAIKHFISIHLRVLFPDLWKQ